MDQQLGRWQKFWPAARLQNSGSTPAVQYSGGSSPTSPHHGRVQEHAGQRDDDLDEEGVAVVPIFGTHFASYAKLFGLGGIRKKCAILTDCDLMPSDADPSIPAEENEGDPAPSRQDLEPLRGPFVEIFSCDTTFERELTLYGTLEPLASASSEIGAPKLSEMLQGLWGEYVFDDDPPDLNAAKGAVLRAAKRFGKARYAQVVSKHIGRATELPQYIRDAIDWLLTDAIDG